jgi:hypothetical protein
MASRSYWAATQPQSLAKAGAALISEGITLLSEASQNAPKLIEACRTQYPLDVQEDALEVRIRAEGLASLVAEIRPPDQRRAA